MNKYFKAINNITESFSDEERDKIYKDWCNYQSSKNRPVPYAQGAYTDEAFKLWKSILDKEAMTESVMTPTPIPYSPATETNDSAIIILFDHDNKQLLSNRGAITLSVSSQATLDNYANSLYNLIPSVTQVFSIIPELYTQAITKLSDEDFYKYIKDNAVSHKKFDSVDVDDLVYNDAIDTDADFDI